MIPHAELIKELGITSKPNLSNILAKKQNIQPAAWEKFRIRFDISERVNGDQASNTPLTGANVTLQDYIDILKENDKFFKTQFNELMISLTQLHNQGKNLESLVKLNLQHTGAVEAAQKGIAPAEIQEQINNEIADAALSQRGSVADK